MALWKATSYSELYTWVHVEVGAGAELKRLRATSILTADLLMTSVCDVMVFNV